jgi:hypothetical protein
MLGNVSTAGGADVLRFGGLSHSYLRERTVIRRAGSGYRLT